MGTFEFAPPGEIDVGHENAGRPSHRDRRDINFLFKRCGITSIAEALELYEEFFPEDPPPPDRTLPLLDEAIAPSSPVTVTSSAFVRLATRVGRNGVAVRRCRPVEDADKLSTPPVVLARAASTSSLNSAELAGHSADGGAAQREMPGGPTTSNALPM